MLTDRRIQLGLWELITGVVEIPDTRLAPSRTNKLSLAYVPYPMSPFSSWGIMTSVSSPQASYSRLTETILLFTPTSSRPEIP